MCHFLRISTIQYSLAETKESQLSTSGVLISPAWGIWIHLHLPVQIPCRVCTRAGDKPRLVLLSGRCREPKALERIAVDAEPVGGRKSKTPAANLPSFHERNRASQLFEVAINCPIAQHYHRPPLSRIDVSGLSVPLKAMGFWLHRISGHTEYLVGFSLGTCPNLGIRSCSFLPENTFRSASGPRWARSVL